MSRTQNKQIKQYLSVGFALNPEEEQLKQLTEYMKEYAYAVEKICEFFWKRGRTIKSGKYDYKWPFVDFNNPYPHPVMGREVNLIYWDITSAKLEAQTIFKNSYKYNIRNKRTSKIPDIVPLLKKASRGYSLNGNNLSFELPNGEIFDIDVYIDDHQKQIIRDSTNKGILTITNNHRLMASIGFNVVRRAVSPGRNIMGVDIGILCPAVCYVKGAHSVRFFGNGRYGRFRRRWTLSKRQKIKKNYSKDNPKHGDNPLTAKGQKLEKQIGRRLNRWSGYNNHEISRRIINFAIEKNVGTIKVEFLRDVRRRTQFHVCWRCGTEHDEYKNKNVDKNNPMSEYTCDQCGMIVKATTKASEKAMTAWVFGDLISKIKYKAKLSGIDVVEVNPFNTSKKCPKCGTLNATNTRHYECIKCGFKHHRDIVAAMNIASG